ncbi:phosphoenolpyruvate--protein phosphotransferase [Acidimicrobiia bacterium]|nr:phosphoenolpyruvate--protein phosphotransferase [Acidimicrobiia bacterium]MDB4834298.1 phosphoenolpyruvate--protein phosphotransferase [Acidimicrobiia bacterium]
MKTYKGKNASPGWSFSKAQFLRNEINFDLPVKFDFQMGLEKQNTKYDLLLHKLESDNRDTEAEIIDAYKLILNDPEILNKCHEQNPRDSRNIYSVFSDAARQLEALDDDYFKQRSEDILSIGKELILTMQGAQSNNIDDEDVIIIAKDLTPNDTSVLNLKKVKGFIVENAGPTSHTVIVAKNLGIPCVIGIEIETLKYIENASIVINGSSGEIYTDPTEEIIEKVQEFQNYKLDVVNNYTEENMSKLGIEFRANIGNEEELELFNDKLINSIGLFRSEFVYIDSDSPPTLDKQISINNKLSRKFSNTVVFRTLDIGGDKKVPYLNLPEEENPFLGIRGIRLSLLNNEIFREQIISILSSELLPKVKIMFPMVSLLDDFNKAKTIVVEEANKLGVEVPKLGVMIETPSAAISAKTYINDVDFFSIGTNDLIQYTLAADRGLASLASYHDCLHPSVLHLINNVIEVGKEYGIEVSVCGDMASDIEGAKILYALGLRIFSLAPSQAPLILSSILNSHEKITNLETKEILSQKNSQNVRSLIR